MEYEDLIKTMHPLEKKVLLGLSEKLTLEELSKKVNLQEIQIRRALQWLSNKEILFFEETKEDFIVLDKNGALYAKEGLPEKRFLIALNKIGKENIPTSQLIKESKLDGQEINICIGALKRKLAIDMSKQGKEMCFTLTKQGKKVLETESLEEKFLSKKFPIKTEDLKDEEKFAFDELKKRRQIVKIEPVKTITIKLKELGKKITKLKNLKDLTSKEEIGKLTPKIIASGSWKEAGFRGFDIKSDVPKSYQGKIHFVNQAIRYIKQVWLEMGFEEMEGEHVDTAFRDLDALFVPQDHPAREMQDTFYIDNPKEGKLPKELMNKVKEMHEHGGNLPSKGWETKYSEKIAKQNLLRTHTTVLSAKTIAGLKKGDLPKKYFAVGKVYRNEALDWKHLFEFHQVEGIVIDPNANLRHLMGYLVQFYKKLGFDKIRLRPGYFPYTEPSLEVDVFHPIKKQWVELGGSGIFRPEVVKPLLGIDVPVLAWGQGMERGIVEYFGLTDLRDLYRNDIKQMREMKYWMK